jgi:hypothetical protein
MRHILGRVRIIDAAKAQGVDQLLVGLFGARRAQCVLGKTDSNYAMVLQLGHSASGGSFTLCSFGLYPRQHIEPGTYLALLMNYTYSLFLKINI